MTKGNKILTAVLLSWLVVFGGFGGRGLVAAQQYDDGGGYYDQAGGPDNLYHDYAARQQDKADGVVAGPGWGKLAGAASVGWFLGSKFHCRRQKKKLDTKFKNEQKALYQQYYEDIYGLQIQNSELIAALEGLGYKVN